MSGFEKLRLLIFAPVAGLALFSTIAEAEGAVHFGQASEGQQLVMSLPDGEVFIEVVFASYGTPNNFTVNPSCHAGASATIVSALALGKQEFSLPAVNGVFGDPCPGVYKRLQVVLMTGPVDTTSSSTTSTTTTTSSTTVVPSETTEDLPTTTVNQSTTTTTTLIEATTTAPTVEPITTTTAVQPVSSSSNPIATSVPTTLAEATTVPVTNEVTTTWPRPVPSTTATTTQSPSTTLSPTSTQTESTVGTTTEPSTVPTGSVPATTETVAGILTPESASEVFAEINVDELTESEAEALIAQVQDAPTEVRQAFEEQIDIYSGAFDSYVPLGSSVPVGIRRVIIAVSVATTLPVARRKTV